MHCTSNERCGSKAAKRPCPTRLEREKLDAGDPNAFDKPDDPKRIGPWILGRTIGKGASGRVKFAQHESTNQFAAVKIIPFYLPSACKDHRRAERHRVNVEREIAMMKLMDHPNVIRIYDVWEGNGNLYLILEWVDGGELFDRLVERGTFPFEEALGYFKQIIYGLSYCHTLSIAHRDLKLENLLLYGPNDNKLIKIADWGMAVFQSPYNGLETACGSPHYVSPEVITGCPYDGVMADVWSAGVVLYTLLCGRPPFEGKDVPSLLRKIQAGRYAIPKDIHPAAADLIRRMLVVNVYSRITIPEILSHPFLMYDTPGIFCTPPPCLFTLQIPMLSPLDLDQDILDDLNVIFGKHVSVDVIIGQLLWRLPNYAKAFYVLLLRFRERQLQSLQGTWDQHQTDVGLHPYRASQSKLRIPIFPPSEYSLWERASRMIRPVVYDVGDTYATSINSPLDMSDPPEEARQGGGTRKRLVPRRRDTAPDAAPAKRDPNPAHLTKTTSHAPIRKDSNSVRPKPKRREIVSGMKILMPLPPLECLPEHPAVPNLIAESPPVPLVQPRSAPPYIHPPDYLVPIDQLRRRPSAPSNREQLVKDSILRAKDVTEESAVLEQTTTCDCVVSPPQDAQHPLLEESVPTIKPSVTCKEGGKRIQALLKGAVFGNESKESRTTARRMIRKNQPAELDLQKAEVPARAVTTGSSGQNTPLLTPVVQEFREWFNNLNQLFHNKTPPYTLFSCCDCVSSRNEVISLLSTTPVTYIQDSGGLLKCKQEEKFDSTGSIIQKWARFRVEFVTSRIHMPDVTFLPGNPEGCTMTFIHEKGSTSTFRAICEGIKAQWRLQPLYSANLNAVYTTDQSPQATEISCGFLMIRGHNEVPDDRCVS